MATATETKPGLTAKEQAELDRLMAKFNAANPHAPQVRVGEPYVALTNLAVPRRNDPDKLTDLVMAGDTVYLTDDEAAKYLRHDAKDGRRIPVIRKVHGPESSSEPNAGRIHPSYLSGPVFRPPAPQPGSEAPRPDPAGSSRLIEQSPVPEAAPPQLGSEQFASADAMDILPGGGLADQIRQGADQDLVSAVRNQMGTGKR